MCKSLVRYLEQTVGKINMKKKVELENRSWIKELEEISRNNEKSLKITVTYFVERIMIAKEDKNFYINAKIIDNVTGTQVAMYERFSYHELENMSTENARKYIFNYFKIQL